MIKQDNSMYISYLTMLKNRIFKVIGLVEVKNKNVSKYIKSQLFELYGLSNVIVDVQQSDKYISLLAKLEQISHETETIDTIDFPFVRSEVLGCLNLIDKMISGAYDEVI